MNKTAVERINGTKEFSLKRLNKIILYLDKTWEYHYDSHRC